MVNEEVWDVNTRTKQKVYKNWDIRAEIAVIQESENGWTQELNLVSWHGGEPKYDIRWWSPERLRSGKGTTINPLEFNELRELIKDIPKDLHLQV